MGLVLRSMTVFGDSGRISLVNSIRKCPTCRLFFRQVHTLNFLFNLFRLNVYF